MQRFSLAALCFSLAFGQGNDRIQNLPGWAGSQAMYAGYINVNSSHGRNLFYWLVESAGNPATDPLVLWTNGGPGCSGLSGGLFSEFGPFFPNPDGSLSLLPNLYSWTQQANIIFIEQPAGVGFSYSETVADYNVGDLQAAEDVYQFLLGFTQRYPQYVGRPLFLSGESYGGHYIPSEAAAVVRGNLAGNNPKLNLQGFFVGNAWTVAEVDNTGALDFWYSRTMIDRATHDGVLATCNMSDVGPLLAHKLRAGATLRAEADWEAAAGIRALPRPLGFTPLQNASSGEAVTWAPPGSPAPPQDCDGWTNQAFNLLGNINIYDIFVDVCPSGAAAQRPSGRALAAAGEGSNNAAGCATNYDPCRDDHTTTYLNAPSVKAAIHANASITWAGCSSVVNYSRFDLLSSMIPTYEFLFQQGLRILVFSGDVDAIVPTLGTREWLRLLPLVEAEGIRPWTVGAQVGGWVTEYDKLTFATIRNAGHMVPEWQSERGLYMVKQFLAGNPL